MIPAQLYAQTFRDTKLEI